MAPNQQTMDPTQFTKQRLETEIQEWTSHALISKANSTGFFINEHSLPCLDVAWSDHRISRILTPKQTWSSYSFPMLILPIPQSTMRMLAMSFIAISPVCLCSFLHAKNQKPWSLCSFECCSLLCKLLVVFASFYLKSTIKNISSGLDVGPLDCLCKQQLSLIFLSSNFAVFRLGHAVTCRQICSHHFPVTITKFLPIPVKDAVFQRLALSLPQNGCKDDLVISMCENRPTGPTGYTSIQGIFDTGTSQNFCRHFWKFITEISSNNINTYCNVQMHVLNLPIHVSRLAHSTHLHKCVGEGKGFY